MYSLVPRQWWKYAFVFVAILVVLALKVVDWLGLPMTDWRVATLTATGVVTGVAVLFRGTGPGAPWRRAWRLVPVLNDLVFPDLNGVWVGETRSNWPTIERMLVAALASRGVEESELHATPDRCDALAVEVRASLFSLSIRAWLSATRSKSHSIVARARREPDAGSLGVYYIYEQSTLDPEITDEDRHVGAAQIEFGTGFKKAEGVYWTRRGWKKGLNTAGRLKLSKVDDRIQPGETLEDYVEDSQRAYEAG